jgi:hypothetical protein
MNVGTISIMGVAMEIKRENVNYKGAIMNPADIDFMSMPAGLNRRSHVNYSANGIICLT